MIKKITMASPKELAAVSKIWLSGNLDAHYFIPKTYWEDHFDEVRTALGQADLLVNVQNGEITGFLGLTGNYIAGLFVKKDYRHLGIGSALMAAAKADFHQLTLSVYVKNQAAYHFYLKNGFSVKTTHVDGDTGEAEYQMSWSSKDK